MAQRFILNEVSYFGAGARKELPEVVKRMNLKKALVCSDKGLIKVGTTKMVTDVLDEAGFPYEIYSEIKPNQQSDALWGKAGAHNNGFAPQSGETYGVVTGSGNVTLYTAANTGSAAAASLPAGTFLSVPKDALPAGGNMVSVQAKVNGTWVSGFIQPEHLAAWYGV